MEHDKNNAYKQIQPLPIRLAKERHQVRDSSFGMLASVLMPFAYGVLVEHEQFRLGQICRGKCKELH